MTGLALPGGAVTAPPADALQIGGLVPLSTVDWPGRLVATVFLQGCPWDCGYCQNVSLLDPTLPGTVQWAEVAALLARRRGLLDGVVFTGGEATRQAALGSAMSEVRAAGFGVGLHTAGAYPRRFAALLPHLDWVGLDIKALPQDYGTVVGVAAGGAKAWETLDIALAAGVGLEVRLTVHPGSPQAATAVEIAHELRARGVRHLAIQQARTQGTRPAFRTAAAGWDQAAFAQELRGIESQVRALGFDTLLVR